MTDYAKQLVQHPKWKWEVGMMTTHGVVARVIDEEFLTVESDGGEEWWWANGFDDDRFAWLDIEHPATKGWLLHTLRDAMLSIDLCTGFCGDNWSVMFGPSGDYPTEGQALAAALLDAWGPA